MIMTGSLFKSEAEFEKALINTLKNKGWKGDVFYRPTEKDLIENWKKIIFENNRDVLHAFRYQIPRWIKFSSKWTAHLYRLIKIFLLMAPLCQF